VWGSLLSYDGLDHLTTWNAGSSGQEQYVYDASGERVLRRSTSAGSTSMTVYAFGLEEHRYSGTGVNQGNIYYYSLGGLLIGEFDGANTNMYLTDALGSVITTISAAPNSASVQGNQVYGPYGTSLYRQGSMDTTKGFTGQYNDSLSGLDYYNARYYDPVVGRFLSVDIVEGDLQGMDPYAYVGGNPETATDPTGLRVISQGGQLGPRNSIVSPRSYPDVKQAAYISEETSRAHGGCPYGSGADCTKQSAQTQTPIAMLVAARSRLNAQVGGVLCASVCVVIPLTTQGSTEVPILVWGTAVTPFSTCFTSPAACAAEEAGGEGAKGEAESSDPGFAPDRLGSEASGLLAAAGDECGPLSFAPETRVTTDHGEQAIGTLQVGERVLAYNPKTGKMELEPIVHVWINHDHDLVDLTITTTTQGQHGKALTKTSEVVHTNQKHPFFTMEQGFLPVGQITLGMHLLRADGRVGVVTGWKVVPGTQVMYNLEVAQDHTFTVGTGQWVVHNCASGPGTGGPGAHLPSGFPGESTDDLGTPTGFADNARLNDHFSRHGSDFGATTLQIYEQQAIDFLSGAPDANELQLQRTNGDYIRFNPTTDEFGIVTQNGIIRTYYIPDPAIHGYPTNLDYFLAQYR